MLAVPWRTLRGTVRTALRIVPPRGEEVGGFMQELPYLKGWGSHLGQRPTGPSRLSRDWAEHLLVRPAHTEAEGHRCHAGERPAYTGPRGAGRELERATSSICHRYGCFTELLRKVSEDGVNKVLTARLSTRWRVKKWPLSLLSLLLFFLFLD